MKVELIQATKDPIKFMADMASICYGHEEAKNPQKLVERLNKLGHHSVFEHAYYTFKIEGISRACLAQLTRHRHASYTVRSQRYCDESNTKYIMPDTITDSDSAEKYHQFIQNIFEFYEEMKQKGIKKEDARFILPQATTTDLYMSFNLRELLLLVELRTSRTAQWEIRDLVIQMVDEVLKTSPELRVLFTFEKEE